MAVLGLCFVGCAAHLDFPQDCARAGPIALVPVGQSENSVRAWASHYARVHRVELEVLSPIEVPSNALDVERQQYSANALIAAIDGAHRAANPKAILVGITSEDLFIERKDWRFAFSLYEDRTVVLSTARLVAEADEPDQLEPRRSKLLTRILGSVYCGFERTGRKTSVMRREVLSADELDQIVESDWKRR